MSDNNHRKIVEGLKNLYKKKITDGGSILRAKVISVSGDNLVQCEADGLDIPDVQLRPIIDGSNRAMLIIPKANSYVLVGSIESQQEYIVLSVEQAEKIIIKVGDITFDILDTVVKLNGDQYDGLVKVGELKSKLNALENKVNDLIIACSSQVVTLAPSGAFPLASFFTSVTALTPTQQSDIENTKVKHG